MSRVLLAALVAGALATTGAAAQGAAAVRSDVQQFVRAYVDAENKPDDATSVMDMVSHKPSVSSAVMGKITRGWEAIRTLVDENVGSPLTPKMVIGVIDVEALGTGYALAVAPFSATLSTPRGDIQVHGALTLVVEKSGGAWKILHEHTSIQMPKPAEGN